MQGTSNTQIRRGDIYYYDFGEQEGSIQCGQRPVLVLQADNFNAKAPTIIVAAITTVIKKQYLPSHIVLGENYGLPQSSMVLLEQIRAVNKSELSVYIGFVNNNRIWNKINIAIKQTFGLWFYERERTGNIRCLCPKCLQAYKAIPNYVVRRLDPLAGAKEKCDKCDKMGWDYIIFDKRTAFGEKGCGNER